ncbi:hypothetical protein EB118_03410 [bacterium]|nr:hypothetical protein [bacterium]
MHKELVLHQHNLQIFNYNYIFKNDIEKKFIDDLYNYKLTESKKDSMVRKLFVHHNIHSVCEFILKSPKKGKQVVYFDDNNLIDGEILEYVDEDHFKYYLKHVYLKFRALLPLRVYWSTFSFEYFVNKVKENNGIGKETVFKIKSLVENSCFDRFTFEKCKKFVRKEGLTFLDKTYFNSLKSKQLLLN